MLVGSAPPCPLFHNRLSDDILDCPIISEIPDNSVIVMILHSLLLLPLALPLITLPLGPGPGSLARSLCHCARPAERGRCAAIVSASLSLSLSDYRL